MIFIQPILLCLLPLVYSQNASSATTLATPSTLTPRHQMSGDLPEEYHIATVSSEIIDEPGLIPSHNGTTAKISNDLEDLNKSVDIEGVESPSNATTSGVLNRTTERSVESANASTEPERKTVFEKDGTSRSTSSSQAPPETTKPYKMKKKVLIAARPKTSFEKPILSNDKGEGMKHESKDLEEEIISSTTKDILKSSTEVKKFENEETLQERSFRFPTTETYDIKLTTSSFLISNIPKLVNNNLLNVIDTSIRTPVEDTTETLLKPVPAKNPSYGTTDQTEWIPLVSGKVSQEWSPLLAYTESPNKVSSQTEKQMEQTEVSKLETSSGAPVQQVWRTTPPTVQNTSSMDFPKDGASWALITSHFTRPSASSTESYRALNITTTPFSNDNFIRKKIKEDPANLTSTDSSLNATKEQNQVLKNTIPDSIIYETTPPGLRKRPTTQPPLISSGSQMSAESTTEMKPTVLDTTTIDFTDVARTIAFEILKTTSLVPRRTYPVTEPTKQKNELTTMSSHRNDVVTMPVDESTFKPTTSPLEEITGRNEIIEDEETSSTEIVIPTTIIIPIIPSKLPPTRVPSIKSTAIPIMTASPISSTTTTEKATTTPKVLAVVIPETTTVRVELPTVVDTEAVTIFATEPSTGFEETEKNDEDYDIILTNNTSQEEITKENVPAFLRLTVQTSEIELCHRLQQLRSSILTLLSKGTQTNVSSDSLVLLNLTTTTCQHVLEADSPDSSKIGLHAVDMFLRDTEGNFNKNLSEVFLTLWGHAGLGDFPLPILKVDFVSPIRKADMGEGMGGGLVAVIVISVVAAVCLILLAILFIVMKRRQKKFNYGQRCTPVSLDAYSLDSVSIRNSGRKGIRASKRSYGNAAFDDPDMPSHPMNFAGLANLSVAKEELFAEFSVIPHVAPQPEEYPVGVETKNRYANVIPLPETRVVLTTQGSEPLSDYINANYVRGLNGVDNTYIAAQGPMESTLPDWWRMIWENQVKVILMLTALQENGVEKCADYLPPNEVTDSLRLFGDYQITLKKRDVKEKYVVSRLQIKNLETNLWREVTHLWYVGWPETGVPSEPNSLIAFLIEARSEMRTTNGVITPAVVHCSPGTGRTGTVIAIDLCIREFEQKRLVDIPRCVSTIRKARAGAVQTRDQYAFIYQVLNTYATKLTGGALDNIQ